MNGYAPKTESGMGWTDIFILMSLSPQFLFCLVVAMIIIIFSLTKEALGFLKSASVFRAVIEL